MTTLLSVKLLYDCTIKSQVTTDPRGEYHCTQETIKGLTQFPTT